MLCFKACQVLNVKLKSHTVQKYDKYSCVVSKNDQTHILPLNAQSTIMQRVNSAVYLKCVFVLTFLLVRM